jgi:transposase
VRQVVRAPRSTELATTSLARRHQVITVETLNASGMRSAGGVYKRGLNGALADTALAEVREQATQEAVKRQPRTGNRRARRGPPRRKARLPDE